ncbi:MAG TPA: NADH-quinone oxidoreductase subunit L [Candidatus Omnitrophota bacterium]|nr:NADH-quinone oxidoreductase subunit L [Candidatus Omnitrophota bacterium]
MTENLMMAAILIPFLSGMALFLTRKKASLFKDIFAVVITVVNLIVAIAMIGKEAVIKTPWVGYGAEFSLRVYHFSSFICFATAVFSVLIAVYSAVFMRNKSDLKRYYAYFLISISLVNGAVLADNLILMLFFWEAILVTIFGLIAIGGKNAFRTATKAFIIVGASDLCMMVGIAMTGYLAGTFSISGINLPINSPMAVIAFLMLSVGALAKAGVVPFHSWLPDAAVDAPLPFMAFMTAAFEKFLGIYFLARITMDIFQLTPASGLSVILMVIGGISILLGSFAAYVQRDMKKMMAYSSISQAGYMILGIGTCLPAGIVGGLFHMINHAIYKFGLFLVGGAVEKEAGTTDLSKLGGLKAKMPVTFACFVIVACAISGVPPFNGFFSKEMVYDGALERGVIFYLVALLGSFFTAASFLKLGHAAFLGKEADNKKQVKEAPVSMLIPMIILACLCVLFGLYNYFPLAKFIQPIAGDKILHGHNFWGMPHNWGLVAAGFIVLAAVIFYHWTMFKKSGRALNVSDRLRSVKGLAVFYDMSGKKYLDPYDMAGRVVFLFARLLWALDRVTDWVYDVLCVKVCCAFSYGIRKLHTGSYSAYILWCLAGALFMMFYILR